MSSVFLQSLILFLQLMDKECYRDIEKIKTIGSTYMAAVGLVPTTASKVLIWFLNLDQCFGSCFGFVSVSTVSQFIVYRSDVFRVYTLLLAMTHTM